MPIPILQHSSRTRMPILVQAARAWSSSAASPCASMHLPAPTRERVRVASAQTCPATLTRPARNASTAPSLPPPLRPQLAGLCDGDIMMVIPLPSKADRFGTQWGGRPLYLRYSSSAPINAAREVAAIELALPCTGEQRLRTPLFTEADGSMTQHSVLAVAFRQALLAMGVSKERADSLTLHSFRRYLACALLGQKVPADTICAIMRWKSIKPLLSGTG